MRDRSMKTSLRSLELVGGPQDGSSVEPFCGEIPTFVYLGRRPLGEKHPAYAHDQTEDFPACYMLHQDRQFQFVGYTPF